MIGNNKRVVSVTGIQILSMTMKKIAIISCSFPPIPGGGIESANYSLYRMLVEKGYDVRVYTYLDYQIDKNYIEKDERVKRFGASKIQLKLDAYWSIFKRKYEIKIRNYDI